MKKFFEKHGLGKSLGILFLLAFILTWIIPAGSFNGSEYVETGLVRLGLSDSGNIIYYMLAMSIDKILFLLALGAFYGIVSKVPAYDNLITKLAKDLKGKEIIFVVLTSVFIAILSSLTTMTFAVLVFVPFIIDLITEMKLDKITAFAVTFGSMLIGSIGATYGSDSLVWFNYYITQQSSFNLIENDMLYRVLILVVALLLFNFFTIVHVKNNLNKIALETKKEAVKTIKKKDEVTETKLTHKKALWITLGLSLVAFIIGCFVMSEVSTSFALIYGLVVALAVLATGAFVVIYKKLCGAGWKYFVPIYNIYILLKSLEMPMWYIALYCIPVVNIFAVIIIMIKLAKKFNKGSGFGILLSFLPMVAAPILAFTNVEEHEYKESEVKEETNNYKGLAIILGITAVLTIIGSINWFGNFGIEMFNKLHEWITGLTVGKDFTLIAHLLGSSLAPFGNQAETYPTWNIYSLISLLVIATILLIVIYRMNFSKMYDAVLSGLKKFGVVALAVFCSYAVYITFYFSPMMATITKTIMPVEGTPDVNIDYNGSGMAFFNIDVDGDFKADENLINQDTNKDGKCDLNCDTDGDGYPDKYLDFDGNKEIGESDEELLETFTSTSILNYDTNQDGYADINVDTDYNVASNIVSAIITSIFHSDLMYTGYSLSGYMISGFSAYLNIVFLIYLTIFGLVAFLAPTSILLVAGLTYTKVEYKDWLKYIWKFAVGMFLCLILVYIMLIIL